MLTPEEIASQRLAGPLSRAEIEAMVDARCAVHIAKLTEQAFPGGDAGAHRRYHEGVIEKELDRKALKRDMRNKVIMAAFWIVVVAVVTAMKEYLLREVQKVL